MYRNDVIITNYENLVGVRGGGDLEVQKKEIMKIANFIDVSLSESEVDSICDNLWGPSQTDDRMNITFNKGRIGRWKEYFSEKNIQEFKTFWNEYLIEWGYESEWNWDQVSAFD